MWVFTSNAFVSIVQPHEEHYRRMGYLLVRGRAKGDVQRFVGSGYPVTEIKTPASDYGFRGHVPSYVVVRAITRSIEELDYTNFKDSVGHNLRKSAYLRVWGAMLDFQRDMEPKQRKAGGTPEWPEWQPRLPLLHKPKRKRQRYRRRATAKGGLR